MVAKSLQILVWAALAALVTIVAFAMLRLRGADDQLAEAEEAITRSEFARAVAVLNSAENAASVQGNAAVRARLWRLRYAANTALDNAAYALRDVDQLLRGGHGDQEKLLLDQIRLQAIAGDGSTARLSAQKFLLDHPGHGRALELAGEACQKLYQPVLRQLLERLQRDLPTAKHELARTHLWSFVYRPNGDPEIASAEAALATLHADEPRLATLWPTLANELRRLREQVQEGLGYFQKSLEAKEATVAAFQVIALSLDQSRRIDDLLVACEIQRRRFDHHFVDEAGAAAAWALLREGHHAAVLATSERWLPPGMVKTRFTTNRWNNGTRDLLTARTWAAGHIADPAAMHRAWQDVAPVNEARLYSFPLVSLTSAFLQLSTKDTVRGESGLRSTAEMLARTPVPVNQFDLLPEVATMWLSLLQARAAPEADTQRVLSLWQTARPATLAPLLAKAALLLDRGQTTGAVAALEEARSLAPDDEVVFARMLATMRVQAKVAGLDGDELLARCLRNRLMKPEVRHDLGYLLCGEAALANKQYGIAMACARAAIDAFPQARQPRLLEIRANLASARSHDAVRNANRLLQLLPPDPETVELALRAHQAAQVDCLDVLATAITTNAPSVDLQIALLRTALTQHAESAVAFVPALTTSAPTSLRILAAHALAASGDHQAAQQLLNALAASVAKLPPEQRVDLAAATAAFVRSAALTTADAALATTMHKSLAAQGALGAADAKALLPTAEQLATTHPATALVLSNAALVVADPDTRTGALYVQAGRLALQAGHWRQCEDHWTAALAFADGRTCAEDLARVCVAQGRPERAQQISALHDVGTDAPMAARFGLLELAGNLIAQDLMRDRADLLAHCALALFGQPSMTEWERADETQLHDRMELLSILREPRLAPFALARVQTVVAAEGPSRTNRLLLARAHAALGDGAAASALHAALATEGCRDPVFLREVALASLAKGYVCPTDLLQVILSASTTGGIADSPLTLAFAMTQMELGFANGGYPALAEQIRLSRWLQPQPGQALTAADMQLVVAKHRPQDAYRVLDQALTGPFACDRGTVIDELQTLARVIARTEPVAIPTLVADAMRYLASDGARGSIVQFLQDCATLLPALAPTATQQRELWRSHVQLVAAGRDREASLLATVTAWRTAHGSAEPVAAIEAVLRTQPTSLALWTTRAELLAGTNRGAAALSDLRAVLRHANSPLRMLTMLTLAAEARALTRDDLAAFPALPQALRESPAGKYAAAMIALRTGKPDVALPMLQDTPARPDGMHLFALGLAALQSKASDGPQQARAAFLLLTSNYANSSLARNALSFANQLAPR